MNINLVVQPLSEELEHNFASLRVKHAACGGSPMTPKRDVANSNFRLECSCGMEILLFPGIGACEIFERAAIGAPPTKLKADSFYCNMDGAQVLVLAED